MKKLLAVVLGVAVVMSVAAFAQDVAQDHSQMQKADAPLKTIKGTVKSEGDKITFVADSDGASWDVMNPETLKDHVGHHVQVSAHVYADKNSIHVMSVKMLKASK